MALSGSVVSDLLDAFRAGRSQWLAAPAGVFSGVGRR